MPNEWEQDEYERACCNSIGALRCWQWCRQIQIVVDKTHENEIEDESTGARVPRGKKVTKMRHVEYFGFGNRNQPPRLRRQHRRNCNYISAATERRRKWTKWCKWTSPMKELSAQRTVVARKWIPYLYELHIYWNEGSHVDSMFVSTECLCLVWVFCLCWILSSIANINKNWNTK